MIFTIKNFSTENGYVFKTFRLAYTIYGALNEQRDNAVWVVHPFTATADPSLWWRGLIGKGRAFDFKRYCIVCANVPGSPYGSTSPLDINPKTKRPYYNSFPLLTPRDVVNSFELLKEHLSINTIRILIGASMGGQIVFQWIVSYKQSVQRAIIIAANPKITSWMLASHHIQKNVLVMDPTWRKKNVCAGRKGLQIARQIGFLSYRSPKIMALSQNLQTRSTSVADEKGFIEKEKRGRKADTLNKDLLYAYLDYQGTKFVERFNSFSYCALLELMNSHDVSKGYKSLSEALGSITSDVLLIGIDSDNLFPAESIRKLVFNIPHTRYRELSSLYGHDAFLIEYKQLEDIILDYLYQIDDHYSEPHLERRQKL